MGHRLSKIVTRTGDAGETGLADGSRIPKSSTRVAALGDIDELNSQLGVLLTQPLPEHTRAPLAQCQHELFDLGGELAMPGVTLIAEAHLERIEAEVQRLNADLPPLKEFVLPGGTPSAAAAHLARAMARRAERAVWTLAGETEISDLAPRYLNRLSDYLFVLARVLARQNGGQEISWKREGERGA